MPSACCQSGLTNRNQEKHLGVEPVTEVVLVAFSQHLSEKFYTEITNSHVFPLQFCVTRWVYDAAVATEAIEIWPNIKSM